MFGPHTLPTLCLPQLTGRHCRGFLGPGSPPGCWALDKVVLWPHPLHSTVRSHTGPLSRASRGANKIDRPEPEPQAHSLTKMTNLLLPIWRSSGLHSDEPQPSAAAKETCLRPTFLWCYMATSFSRMENSKNPREAWVRLTCTASSVCTQACRTLEFSNCGNVGVRADLLLPTSPHPLQSLPHAR